MKRAFLIARQEFIKYVTRRGFAISILMFPLWIMVVILVPQWTGGGSGPKRQVFTIVDQAGSYRAAVLEALARENSNRAAGHHARFVYIDPPSALDHAAPQRWSAAARPYLSGDRQVGSGDRLSAVLFIPKDFGASGHVIAYYFAGDLSDTDLRDVALEGLSRALQKDALVRLAPQLARSGVLDAAAVIESRDPTRGSGPDGDALRSTVPIALAIILFVVSVMNAGVLLQGVVEEKSTRMIEVLLSCATAREITTGKLIGVIGVALTTLLIWGLALLALSSIASHETVTLVFASLRATASLQTLPLLLVFFLCGLLIYGSLFLAIGSMANSLADAQSLLGPSMLILMLPNVMIARVMHDPNGTLATTLSWVPIYTPFFMMLRIASHPPVWQLWGTLALAVATTALLIWWTGRVFANHVLTTERPPSLGRLVSGMFAKRG